jgi:hypothetical protein
VLAGGACWRMAKIAAWTRSCRPSLVRFAASPGDLAVYGLSLGAVPSAVHVAVVTADPSGQRGPDVVNGDGDQAGFSVVETGTDQVHADAGHADSTLAGYVSPP